VRVQCLWEQILPQLDRGDIDFGLNGIESTSDRVRQYQATIPYFIYQLVLVVRKDRKELNDWKPLQTAPADGSKWRIGVLSASAADRYVTERFLETAEIFRYEGSTEQFRLLDSGQLDAAVMDDPIPAFYLDRIRAYPGLHTVGKPEAPGEYLIYLQRDNAELTEKLNAAIKELYSSGKLKEIYSRYGLWTPAQERLPELWAMPRSEPDEALSRFTIVSLQSPLLLQGAMVTAALAILAMPLAIALGAILAVMRAWSTSALGGESTLLTRALSGLATLYIEVIRGTPLAFQLFVVYFLLPVIGIRISGFWSGVIALAVNYSANEAEVIRSGLQAVPRGQMEAALSLGMSRLLAIRRILAPQVIRYALPNVASDFIALFKDTAVCSVIAVQELSKEYSMAAKSTQLFFELAFVASLMYLLMSYPLSLASRWIEKTLKTDG
jgi:polar amino acid transport system substrate-binding protein